MANGVDAKGSWLARALPSLLIAAALLLLVLPVLDPSLQLYDRDTSACEAPFKWEIWRRLALRQLPLWVTWTEGGTSLLGQMTPGLFHPTALLYLLPLPFELLFKLQHLLALPLAASGLYLLARRLGAERFGAAGGAIAYAGSGWVVSMASSNLHYALGAAAIPWALHGLLRFFETRRPRWLLWSAWALSWPVVAGEPQSALFAGLMGIALALGMREPASGGVSDSQRKFWRGTRFRRLAMTASWGACALALAAPAEVPVLLRLHGLARAPGQTVGRDYFALPPWRLFGLALPSAFDETLETTSSSVASIYEQLSPRLPGTPFAQGITLGLPVLLLALFAPRRKRRWLVGGGLLCVLAALGTRLPVDGLLLHLVPPLRWFRYPEKWLGPATLLFCLAAALGASALFETARPDGTDASGSSPRAPARTFARASLGCALLLALLALLLGHFGDEANRWIAEQLKAHAPDTAALFVSRLHWALIEETGIVAALAGCIWAATLRQRSGVSRLGAALCAAVLGGSALVDSGTLLYTMPLAELRANPPLADYLRERTGPGPDPIRIESRPKMEIPPTNNIRAGTVLWRIHALATEYNAYSGVENIASYSSLDDADYLELLYRAPDVLRDLFDVQFLIAPESRVEPERRRAEGWEPLPLGLALQQRARGPRAFLVPCAEALERKEAFAQMIAPGFDAHEVAIARGEDAARLGALACPLIPVSAPLGKAAWTRPSPEEIDVEVDAAAPALLVIAEHFDPGWSVSIDGAPKLPALQVDRAALGAPVAAGPHRIVFKFFPQGLLAGLACALGCVALLLGAELSLGLRVRR